MDLPTYTNIWRIEKRLYKLYDLRLPMPLPIVWIGVFVGVFVPWSLLLILVGVPVKMPWHVLFLVPPGIVTWLSTRPVIEGKRLTELLESQLRYLGQPKAWYRLAPTAEPETVTFSGRVWRTAPVRAKSKKAPRKARQPLRGREGQRITGPRQVRPAVAAAAAAAAQAPVAEPPTGRTGWGTRRGTAPALRSRVRQAAGGSVPEGSAGPVRREEGLSGGSGRVQELPVVAPPTDDTSRTAPAPAEREPASTSAEREPASADEIVAREAVSARGSAGAGRRGAGRERRAAGRDAVDGDAAEQGSPVVGETANERGAGAGGATAAVESRRAPDPEYAVEPGQAHESGHAHEPVQTRGESVQAHGEAGAEELAAREVGEPIRTAESRKAAAGKPIDTEALRRLRRLAASADAPAGAPEEAEAGSRREAGRGSGPEAGSGARREGAGHEDEAARDQHRKGQPPRLAPRLVLSGTQTLWPPLNPDAKPLPRPGTRKTREQEQPHEAEQSHEAERQVPAEAAREASPEAAREATPEVTLDAAPEAARGAAPEVARETAREEAGDASAEAVTQGAAEVEAEVTGEAPAPDLATDDRDAVTGDRDAVTDDRDAVTGDRGAAPGRDPKAPARGSKAPARDRPVPVSRFEASAGDETGAAGEREAAEELVAPVPVPRPGEGRVRRVESVVGRDSGGWRRIAQVVVGGGGVRTDGSEIDEARARAVFGGGRRIVVLGCTGGAGQSTTALMLGHTFAQYRDDRIVAVDANTGGGTLTSKIEPETPETLTSLLSGLDRVSGYLTMRGYTTRTASGLEVISADTDAGAEQRLADRSFFSDHRLGESMRLLDRHYKLAVIDPAAALAARLLPYADQLVLVVPASEEASEAVAMTYEWLDGHGCAELRRRAVMVVNGVSRRSMTDVEQAESVARGRCRAIVRVPWEDDLAPGGAEVVDPGQLRAAGRRAYLALAGVVVAGFAAQSVRPSEEEWASDPPGTRIGER
ncbi:TcpE family conjugal transfer membrane protein [Nonomuraea sp. NPDC050404]|uniref:TcpE family conjugal transfer membrane protein n=1 Tax=Nonomuraea sp. NPDC050404 TaxID=3155783 RepID=UPI0033E5D8D3